MNRRPPAGFSAVLNFATFRYILLAVVILNVFYFHSFFSIGLGNREPLGPPQPPPQPAAAEPPGPPSSTLAMTNSPTLAVETPVAHPVVELRIEPLPVPYDLPPPPPPRPRILAKFRNSSNVCEPFNLARIDVVYTWCDGGDPQFLKDIEYYEGREGIKEESNKGPLEEGVTTSRFRDFQELRYSMRSLIQSFGRYIRNIFIVTNGQVPSFLDFDKIHYVDGHPIRLYLISHRMIYPADDQPFLPTFSSPSIETVLHLIPGITERFLYLNNDLLLNRPFNISDFFILRPKPPYQRGKNWRCEMSYVFNIRPNPVRASCQPCPEEKEKQPRCSVACYFQACPQDKADCEKALAIRTRSRRMFKEPFLPSNSSLSDFALREWRRQKTYRNLFDHEPMPYKRKSVNTLWRYTVLYVNGLYNLELSPRNPIRGVLGHLPLLIDVDFMNSLHHRFPIEFLQTRRSRFRSNIDMQTQFSYYYYVIHSSKVKMDRGKGKVVDGVNLVYSTTVRDLTHNRTINTESVLELLMGRPGWKEKFLNLFHDRSPLRHSFVALQDSFLEDPTAEDFQYIEDMLKLMLPEPTAFEKNAPNLAAANQLVPITPVTVEQPEGEEKPVKELAEQPEEEEVEEKLLPEQPETAGDSELEQSTDSATEETAESEQSEEEKQSEAPQSTEVEEPSEQPGPPTPEVPVDPVGAANPAAAEIQQDAEASPDQTAVILPPVVNT